MARVLCFRHPQYTGQTSPDLSCRACCSIFIEAIKAERDRQSAEDAKAWVPLTDSTQNSFAPAADAPQPPQAPTRSTP
jgi:hypothetical protein